MKYQVSKIFATDFEKIARLYGESSHVTFQHSLEFLSYHGNRFKDESIIVLDQGVPLAYMLAARSETDPSGVETHPGTTFSGLVTSAEVKGSAYVALLASVLNYYQNLGFSNLIYREMPAIYSSTNMGDFRYAAFRNKALLERVLLSSVIDLRKPISYSSRRIRILKKISSSYSVSEDWNRISEYWEILCQNLAIHHQATPIHTLEEIILLKNLFSDEISLVTVIDEDSDLSLAGVLLFRNKTVWKTQYIASSEVGRANGALDYVINETISLGLSKGVTYLDLGTSNESSGLSLNDGLHRFKSEFGAEGVSYEQFRFNF